VYVLLNKPFAYRLLISSVGDARFWWPNEILEEGNKAMSDDMNAKINVATFTPLQRYDSGWVAANANSNNELSFDHNLGVIPSQITVLFSADQNVAYPVLGYWTNANTGNPVTISMGAATILLEIWSGAPLHGAWLASANQWTVWKQGYFRVLAWK